MGRAVNPRLPNWKDAIFNTRYRVLRCTGSVETIKRYIILSCQGAQDLESTTLPINGKEKTKSLTEPNKDKLIPGRVFQRSTRLVLMAISLLRFGDGTPSIGHRDVE